jgi:LysM repeat protein
MTRCILEKRFAMLAIAGALPVVAFAQVPPPALTKIEPGLEPAIRWKWQVEPSSPADWGLPVFIPVAPALAPNAPQTAPAQLSPSGRPDTYVVKRGDALVLIGKRFHVSVDHLKAANGLTNNLIRIGQTLSIPPADPLPVARPKSAGHASDAASQDARELETLTLQVCLDRAGFSAGPIDGVITPAFQTLVTLFLSAHPEIPNAAALPEKAHAALPDPFVHYTLRPEDFRFIAPPKAVAAQAPTATPSKKKKSAKPAEERPPKPTFADLTTARMLAYRSGWEFVAERFHCNEETLRKLNPGIKGLPLAGTEFRVPNVIPFAIEAPLVPPLQPVADPGAPVTAALVDRTRLEITRGGRLIAVLPVSIARPGLRGTGSWIVLDAIPHPRLRIRQDFATAAATPTRIYGRETPTDATPTPTPIPQERTLAAGPENPVGVLWINLAKSGETTPLPYGLHGTSIPDEMATHQSFGGLRMANWDITRAVRLLPPGTPIEWKQGAPMMIAPAAHP